MARALTPSAQHGWFVAFLGLAVCSLIALLFWQQHCSAPNFDELAHLSGGLYSLETGRFDLYTVNPPLVRTLAAIPGSLMGLESHAPNYVRGRGTRLEWEIGAGLVDIYGVECVATALWYGRILVMAFPVIGLLSCSIWAKQVYGSEAACVAAVIWVFEPNMLAWSSSIGTDVPAAALGILTAWLCYRWCESPRFLDTWLLGLALGFCLLSKFSMFVVVLWVPVSCYVRQAKLSVTGLPRARCSYWLNALSNMFLLWSLALLVFNAGYLFEDVFHSLSSFTFVSELMSRAVATANSSKETTLVAAMSGVPLPLPANAVSGVDLQRLDFEGSIPMYLFGQWHEHGQWYWYLLTALVKLPVPLFVLAALRICHCFAVGSIPFKDLGNTMLWIPPLSIAMLVSSQTGMVSYFRYFLPCLPFFYLWLAGPCGNRILVRTIRTFSIIWLVAGTLVTQPFNHSFVNEFAGASSDNWRWVNGCQLDWGEDAFRLRDWVLERQDIGAIYLDIRSPLTSTQLHIPQAHRMSSAILHKDGSTVLLTGWYALSVDSFSYESPISNYFRSAEPTAKIGYSINIYRLERPTVIFPRTHE